MIDISTPGEKIEEEKKAEDKKEVKNVENKIEKTETKLLNEVGNLYNEINKDKVNISNLQNSINSLSMYNNTQEYSYLSNLLKPEKCKGGKIPSSIPVPSCAFQLHNCVTLTTNSSGNIAIFFNPFFLANESITSYQGTINGSMGGVSQTLNYSPTFVTSLWVNNTNSLTGSAPDNHFEPINIGQVIPQVYDQFRLVSASLVIKYIGRLDITSGVIGGAIIFDESKTIGGNIELTTPAGVVTQNYQTPNPDLAKYGNFDLAMDSFYHQENLTLEGVRELYFPVDNSFEEYVKVLDVNTMDMNIVTNAADEPADLVSATFSANQDYYKSGFNFMIYTLGAPADSACLKLDIYCNFECLPNAKFLNYLPISMTPYHLSPNDKNRASRIIQQKPVMKSKEGDEAEDVPNIWLKLKRKFGNSLPGIKKMINNGLINAIPSLKPGISLAAAMMNIEDDY